MRESKFTLTAHACAGFPYHTEVRRFNFRPSTWRTAHRNETIPPAKIPIRSYRLTAPFEAFRAKLTRCLQVSFVLLLLISSAQLTARSSIIIKKLIVIHLLNKLLTFNEIPWFITVYTKDLQQIPSWVRWIQSILPPYLNKIWFNILFLSTKGLHRCLFPWECQVKISC